MSLVMSEDQLLLQDSARSFCKENVPVSKLRHLRDTKDATGFDPVLWEQMVALGWTGMAISETYGGFDFGYFGLGIVLEETGRNLVSSPLVPTLLLGATTIGLLGSEQQKQALLPGIVSGELLMALALEEHPIHAPSRIATSAVRKDSHYLLNGKKVFVVDGHTASKLLVVARTSGSPDTTRGISVFLVDPDAPGVTITRTWMVDSRNAAIIEFKDVQVPEQALLGAEGMAWESLSRVLDIARIGLSAEMLGGMQEAFERTLEYLKQREQFGVLIGSFQGLQHRAATMYSDIELCKSLVRAALSALDNPAASAEDIAKLASAAKAKVSEVFFTVSNEAIQMHGGIGMTDEFDIGFYIKRARVSQQFLGDANFHRDRYATLHKF